MIYAAWFDLHNDDTIVAHPTALRVYAHLLRNPLIFMRPQEVKLWVIARSLRTNNGRVIAALNLLVKRGYVLEHERGQNNARRVSLLMERTPPAVVIDDAGSTETVPPSKTG